MCAESCRNSTDCYSGWQGVDLLSATSHREQHLALLPTPPQSQLDSIYSSGAPATTPLLFQALSVWHCSSCTAQRSTVAFSIDHAGWKSLRSQDNWASVLHSSLETLETHPSR